MNYFEMVEQAWRLSDAAREYVKNAVGDVSPEESYQKVFALSPLVDQERTGREGGVPLARVFLKSPYGLAYRADSKDWIPFRHAPVDISEDPSPVNVEAG